MSNKMADPCILTLGTHNRMAGIIVVGESFLKHHPNGKVYVCLIDRCDLQVRPSTLPGYTFFADELPLPGKRRFFFKYEAYELCGAIRPFAIRYVIEQLGIPRLVYLDSDILVTNPFWDDLLDLWANYSVLLTPHFIRLPTDLSAETQRSVNQHGAFNSGFLAIRENKETLTFLDWWSSLLETLCTFDPMHNVFVDQRWLDLAAASSTAVGILRDPGMNVGYWNLHERNLNEYKTSGWKVDDRPLKFFHFSGFDRDRVTTKVDCSHATAAALGRYYGILLDAAGEQEFNQLPYGWNRYCDGTQIPPEHRDLILGSHPDLEHVENPFDLPTMVQEWKTIQQLARSTPPLRISQRYRDSQKILGTFRRLYRHPLIGPIWRVWRRLVNPSLGADLPPYVRS